VEFLDGIIVLIIWQHISEAIELSEATSERTRELERMLMEEFCDYRNINTLLRR
jgi:hypothetical protein